MICGRHEHCAGTDAEGEQSGFAGYAHSKQSIGLKFSIIAGVTILMRPE
jgi:hypothetical protein